VAAQLLDGCAAKAATHFRPAAWPITSSPTGPNVVSPIEEHAAPSLARFTFSADQPDPCGWSHPLGVAHIEHGLSSIYGRFVPLDHSE
jgi:hypothetical protein